MSFNPEEKLIALRKDGKRDYLETKWRLVWFRERHPDGCVSTEVLSVEPPLVKATVYSGEGQVLGTGHAGADDSRGNPVWKGRSLEKAETAAVGRALAMAGYGTQFVGQELDDGIADSPTEQSAANSNVTNFNAERERLGANGERRVGPDPYEDLTNRDTAADFLKNTRKAGIKDDDVLHALGVEKLTEWTKGRKAAALRVKAWHTTEQAWEATSRHFKARAHFDNWLAQQYGDGIVGLDVDELIAAIEADRVAQGKSADQQFAELPSAFN